MSSPAPIDSGLHPPTPGVLDQLSRNVVVVEREGRPVVHLRQPLTPPVMRRDPRALFLAVLYHAVVDLVVDDPSAGGGCRPPGRPGNGFRDPVSHRRVPGAVAAEEYSPRECVEAWWFSDASPAEAVSLDLIAALVGVDVDRLRDLGRRALAIRNSALSQAAAA